MGVDVNCDICFHSSTGKFVRKSQKKYYLNRDHYGLNQQYSFDFACHDYGYMHGCDVIDVMNDDRYKYMSNSTLSGGT